MEWEEHFDNGVDMVAGAKARIEGEDKPIRYINGRYKLVGEEESRWLFNIAYQIDGDEPAKDGGRHRTLLNQGIHNVLSYDSRNQQQDVAHKLAPEYV